jgi:hypothetical protein
MRRPVIHAVCCFLPFLLSIDRAAAQVPASEPAVPAPVPPVASPATPPHLDAAPAATHDPATHPNLLPSQSEKGDLDNSPPPARGNRALRIAGLVTLGVGYLASVGFGIGVLANHHTHESAVPSGSGPGGSSSQPTQATDCADCALGYRLLVPLAGPWLALPYSEKDLTTAILIDLGLAQLSGALMTVIGITGTGDGKTGKPASGRSEEEGHSAPARGNVDGSDIFSFVPIPHGGALIYGTLF